jgi:hypothetical protein
MASRSSSSNRRAATFSSGASCGPHRRLPQLLQRLRLAPMTHKPAPLLRDATPAPQDDKLSLLRWKILPARKAGQGARQQPVTSDCSLFSHLHISLSSSIKFEGRQHQVRQLSPLPCARCSGEFGGSERPRKKAITPRAMRPTPKAKPIHCKTLAICTLSNFPEVGRGKEAIGSSLKP